MSGPFANFFGNQRVVAIPVSPQDQDRVTVTAVAAVNFADLLPVGANTRATNKCVVYLHELEVTTTNFPAAIAGVTGFIQVEFLDGGGGVVVAAINLKAFEAFSGNAAGMNLPYTYTPAAPRKQIVNNAGLATAVNARFKANVTAIIGAPSFTVELSMGVDSLNTGPTGAIGGQDITAQGVNNPNAF